MHCCLLFCSFILSLRILFLGYFRLAAPDKTLRFPRATLQLPQKKPTSSGIFSCCFSCWSLRVFSYAREAFRSTYISYSLYYGCCLERRTVDSYHENKSTIIWKNVNTEVDAAHSIFLKKRRAPISKNYRNSNMF